MGFPKLSMIAFYWAYFPVKENSGMRKALWGITGFVCACYLAILFDDTFFCGADVSVQWSQEEGACSVFYAPEPFILNFTLNLACYLVGESLLRNTVCRVSRSIRAAADRERCRSLRAPPRLVDPGCARTLEGCYCDLRPWCLDHHDDRRPLRHPQDGHRSAQPCL